MLEYLLLIAVHSYWLVVEAIVHFTDGGASVVAHVVLVGDEEYSIVCIHESHLLLQLGCPFVTLVWPVAHPLLVTPGVSQFKQLQLAMLLWLELPSLDDSIGVITDETKLGVVSGVKSGLACRGADDVVAFICLNDLIPDVLHVLVIVEINRGTSQAPKSLTCETSDGVFVIMVQLSPHFLKKKHPQLFRVAALAESRHKFAVLLNSRELVINCNSFELTVKTDACSVYSSLIAIRSQYDVSDTLR